MHTSAESVISVAFGLIMRVQTKLVMFSVILKTKKGDSHYG